MRILIDMDEVLVHTLDDWLYCYNHDYDDDKTIEDIKSWAVHDWIKPECGTKVYEYLALEDFFKHLMPIEGAVEGVKLLMELGHDVVIVSACPITAPGSYAEKLEWIKERMPFFPLKSFISCHRKDLVSGDVLLDDGAHNLKDFPGVAVCMDRPWNRDESHNRVYSWTEFICFIKLIDIERQ